MESSPDPPIREATSAKSPAARLGPQAGANPPSRRDLPLGSGRPAPEDPGLLKRPSTPDRLWEEPLSPPAYRYWDLPLDSLPRWAGMNAHLGSGPEALEARENIRRQRGGNATSAYWASEGPTLEGIEIILQMTSPAGRRLQCRSRLVPACLNSTNVPNY